MMMVEVITDDESMSSRCKHDTVMLFIQMLMLRWRGSKAKNALDPLSKCRIHQSYSVCAEYKFKQKKKIYDRMTVAHELFCSNAHITDQTG